LQGDDAEKSEMQGSPPEHADKLPAAPRSQWYRDETKYVERNHGDMKPEDRLSYIDGKRCVHLVVGSLIAIGFSTLTSKTVSGWQTSR
jgi:hypothetical protein